MGSLSRPLVDSDLERQFLTPAAHDETAPLKAHLKVLDIIIRLFQNAVGLSLRQFFDQPPSVGTILVKKHLTGRRKTCEKISFGLEIFFHAMVKIQMVPGKLSEDPELEFQSMNTFLADRMRRNFHDTILDPFLLYLVEHRDQNFRSRRRVDRWRFS